MHRCNQPVNKTTQPRPTHCQITRYSCSSCRATPLIVGRVWVGCGLGRDGARLRQPGRPAPAPASPCLDIGRQRWVADVVSGVFTFVCLRGWVVPIVPETRKWRSVEVERERHVYGASETCRIGEYKLTCVLRSRHIVSGTYVFVVIFFEPSALLNRWCPADWLPRATDCLVSFGVLTSSCGRPLCCTEAL